ncbi:MAG: ABC transporter permease [Chitinophagales bacterium]
MGKFIFRRILFFIPTLIVISLLAFIISINAPGDPVQSMLSNKDSGTDISNQSTASIKERERWRKKLGLDLPVFYFSISNLATPDTIYKIYDDNERYALKRILAGNGNWTEIAAWNLALKNLYSKSSNIIPDSVDYVLLGKNLTTDTIRKFNRVLDGLRSTYDETVIQHNLAELKRLTNEHIFLDDYSDQVSGLEKKYLEIKPNATRIKNYIPVIHFYGYNQYHRWIFGDGNILTGKKSTECAGLIRGDFGYSYETKLKVSTIIGERMRWSLLLTLISIILAYLISLPIGLQAAAKKNSLFDRTSSVILFMLYSLPVFWVATLLLMTFANTQFMNIFPASGIQPATGIPDDANFFEIIKLRLPYLILPTIAYTYSQLAFLSRITRVATLEIISQDYIRTARAKGLPERKVIYKHAFRNTLLPIITIFSNVFPLALSGSVILETIFTIPGMGQQIFHAIGAKDYPVIVDVFTLTGILTLAGYLIADILYAIADPRISYSSK